MKVAFLKPPIGGILGLEMLTFVEPLGMECVAAILEQRGHECAIIDLRIDGLRDGLEKARRFDPDIIGIQCNFTTERFRTRRLARTLKSEFPDAFLVVGGHDCSRDPRWFDDPSFDAVAIGEGEEIMPALANALQDGRSPETAPGLMLNAAKGQVMTQGAIGRTELDELPKPARHLITDYAPHYYINYRKPLALMETARGCPYRCNFCSVWKFHEKTFREKSPERVVEELSEIEAPNIFITDDIFWLNVKRAKKMAELIKASGIKKFFTVQTRTDIICRHPELVEIWKDCGNLAIFMGLEKVNDKELKSINKNNKAANNVQAIELLKSLDVGFTCNFIVDPSWERHDFEELRTWIDKYGTYNSGFSVLTPLPGTDLWSDAEDNVTTGNWELYDIVHSVLPTRLPLDEFYEEYANLWKWALEVRFKHRGKLNFYKQMVAAVLSGKVSMRAVRKGMNLAKVFSDPDTFLEGHRGDLYETQEADSPGVPA